MKARGSARSPAERIGGAFVSDPLFMRIVREVHVSVHDIRLRWLASELSGTERVLAFARYLGEVERAQATIVRAMLLLEANADALRSRTDMLSLEKKVELDIVELKLHLLRRLNDSLLWDLVHGQLWIFRRLCAGRPPTRLGSSNVESALNAAEVFCRGGPLRTALVADATTFVELGDVIGFEFVDERPRITLIEVKEGAVNELLIKMMKGTTAADEDELVGRVAREHGAEVAKQASRMFRQARRLDDVTSLIRENRGVGIDGFRVSLSDGVQVLGTFAESVHACLHALATDRKRVYAIDCIEGCAFIGAYQGAMRMESALRMWMNAHGSDGPIIDVVGGLCARMSPPIFSLISDWKLLAPLLRRDTRLYVGIDLNSFDRIARDQGFALRWVGGKRARRTLAKSADLLEWKGQIAVTSATDCEEGVVGSAILARIALDFTVPSAAISLVDPRRMKLLVQRDWTNAEPLGRSEVKVPRDSRGT